MDRIWFIEFEYIEYENCRNQDIMKNEEVWILRIDDENLILSSLELTILNVKSTTVTLLIYKLKFSVISARLHRKKMNGSSRINNGEVGRKSGLSSLSLLLSCMRKMKIKDMTTSTSMNYLLFFHFFIPSSPIRISLSSMSRKFSPLLLILQLSERCTDRVLCIESRKFFNVIYFLFHVSSFAKFVILMMMMMSSRLTVTPTPHLARSSEGTEEKKKLKNDEW